MATKQRASKKIEVPGLVIKELRPKQNKEFNEGLGRYVEMVLRKQAGEPIADMYTVPVLKIKGRSAARNAEINKQFERELNLALEKASSAAIAPIVVGIVGGIIGNIVGNIVSGVIQDKCAD